MKAVKAVYDKGRIKFSEKPSDDGPVEVMVVFPDRDNDPWEKILNDPKPRTKLNQVANRVKKQIAQGKAKPLDIDEL